MSITPTLKMTATVSYPMSATDVRAFLDAAETAMDDVTVTFRQTGGQLDKASTELTATGFARTGPPRPHTNYRGGEEA